VNPCLDGPPEVRDGLSPSGLLSIRKAISSLLIEIISLRAAADVDQKRSLGRHIELVVNQLSTARNLVSI
jgi:hypothetical protein